jgi:L-ascorbate metabolism protein UlaG (beta-lactamase superfamily)
MTNRYRLADSTVCEPLINHWAIWADLISPAPYSMHVANYQIPTLTSYLADPELHLKACRNPKLVGGPFVDVPTERKGEVQALLDKTRQEQKANLDLAKSITDFSEYLQKEIKGQSLEPYYANIPPELKGYVELLYDYHNHPVLRIMESFMYRSRYYNPKLQSVRLFQPARDNSRHFFLSTPHLPGDGEIDWKVNFSDPATDELFRTQTNPLPLEEIMALLGLGPEHTQTLMPMLTQDVPSKPEPWAGTKPRVRYLGHACVLVEWNGTSIMTDPWLGVIPTEGGMERVTYKDLPEKIDFAVITHGHHDHFVPETLIRLRHKIGTLLVPKSFGLMYADVSLKLAARELGIKNVIEVDSLESIPFPGGEIIAAPFFGEHADLAHAKMAYVVRAGDERLLFAADSNCIDPQIYVHLKNAVGEIQTVFLGMECVGAPLSWLYGALLPSRIQHSYDKTRRTKGSDSKAALALIDAVRCNRVYIYAMGNEPWLYHCMGIGSSGDSPQIKEASKVLEKVRATGFFLDAQRPYGKMEIRL